MLQRIDIVNFRSIKNQTIQFEHNMTTLVGINESGKSNILKAMSMISTDVPLSRDDIRDPGHDEEPPTSAYVQFVFNLEDDMIDEVVEILKGKIPSWSSPEWIVEREKIRYTCHEFLKTQRNHFVYVANLTTQKKYFANWTFDTTKYQSATTWKRIIKGQSVEVEIDGQINELDEGDVLGPELVALVNSEVLGTFDLTAFVKIIDESISSVAKDYLPDCIHWKYSEGNLLPDRVSKASFAQNPLSCIPLRNMFLLAGYRDASKTIVEAQVKTNGIANVLRKISQNTTAHMRSVWPEWENIKIVVRENGDYFESGIEDKYNVFSASRRSDGFKRFLTFLLLISAQNKSNQIVDNILIIDEPEIGLHPSGVRFLRQELESIARNNLVVVATHSIFMIDSNIIDRHLIVEKDNEVTKISRVESSNINDEEVIFKALGYSLFEILRPMNIIFEGWKDKYVFKKYLEGPKGVKLFPPDRMTKVGLLHALGAKDVDRVANICENFDRKYLILTDSDAPAKERKRNFRGRGEWICYDEIEGIDAVTTEDFIDNRSIGASVDRILERENISATVRLTVGHKIMKIKAIADQLSNQLVPEGDKGRLVKLVKDDICENLTLDSLSPSYYKVVQQLSDRVKKL